MSMKREAPTGILGFPVAPMNEQGDVDIAAFEANVQFLLDGGLSAIFVACGAGELHALKHTEYKQMIESALSIVKGRVPVYSGIGGNITHAQTLATMSEELGVDGYLILPPYLINAEQEGLYQYLSKLISSTDLNAIIYQRDNCILTVETIERLTKHPQLIAVKDGVGDMELNMELVQKIGDRLSYMSGIPMAEVTFAAFANIGFDSYSSAISNYIPHISRLFYDSLMKSDMDMLRELYTTVIFPLNRIRKKRNGYNVALIKAGMEIVGLPVGAHVRPPLIPVEQEHYDEMKVIIERALTKFPKPVNN